MAIAAFVVIGGCLLVAPAGAGGQERSVTASEAAQLARRAVTDDGALADLRDVTQVDGRRVDMAAVTSDLGSGRAARLEALARRFTALGGDVGTRTAIDRDQARRSARDVLEADKFHERQLPKPFRGPLRWLTDRLAPVGRAIDATAGALVRAILRLPGGSFIIVGLVVGAAALLAVWLARRASRAVVASGGPAWLVDPAVDPAELDRRADRAELDGDLDDALRLRFEAGLVRLVRADRLDLRPDTTAAGAARQVDDATMDRLTADFEEVVYGGRHATTEDLDRSRRGWAELHGAGSRR